MTGNKLEEYRGKIDKIDEEIAKLLAERLILVKQIGKFKKENNIPVVDENRFNKVLEKVENIASKERISKDFIDEIYYTIHKYACELEK